MEDSVIINQSAIDRAFFRASALKKYEVELKKNASSSRDDEFGRLDKDKVSGMGNGDYSKLNPKGHVPEGTELTNKTIIIGKMTPVPQVGEGVKPFRDSSEMYKYTVPGFVDRVWADLRNADDYPMIKMRVRSERIPQIGDKFCIKGDTEVLTLDGWKKIKDVTREDQVASLLDGKYLQYEKPIDVYHFKYDGKMYKLRSQQVDLDVTIDHELFVKKRNHTEFELVPAGQMIGKRYRLKKDCENPFLDEEWLELPAYKNRNINKPAKRYDYDAFLELLGIFISDGNVYEGKQGKYRDKYICISGEKQRKINHLREIAENLGVNVVWAKDKDTSLNDEELGCGHRIHDIQLANYLEPLSVGAINKFLPDYVWDLSQRQARILLNSLISGDGSHNNNGSECYYTSSRRLADDVMRLAIHAGWSGSIKLVRPKGSKYKITNKWGTHEGTTNADALSVRIVKSKNEPEVNHGHIKTQNGQSESTYHYKGDVYCLEVSNHVFMIRQNDKNVFIGNCSRHGQKG
jgi:hypothetical protein